LDGIVELYDLTSMLHRALRLRNASWGKHEYMPNNNTAYSWIDADHKKSSETLYRETPASQPGD